MIILPICWKTFCTAGNGGDPPATNKSTLIKFSGLKSGEAIIP